MKSSRQRSLFERVWRAARERSDLMRLPPTRRGEVIQLAVLQNLAAFGADFVRPPEEWPGAAGHPLRVVDSFARHLFGRYPTPRFLASAWFGGGALDRVERRRWFIAHARGERFRSLALPIAMTRQMEHVFLRTPDHLAIDPALRRAEVLGLGGTPELADAILATRLAEEFVDGERWRVALAWLVGCGDAVKAPELRRLVDFLGANLANIVLRGRTFASVMRLACEWHGLRANERAQWFRSWPRSPWAELVVRERPTPAQPRAAEWRLVELLDSSELVQEGRALRHCIATYVRACVEGRARIWSLRHRWSDELAARPVLTIEVRLATAEIVLVRGKLNARPTGWPLELVRQWAARDGLMIRQRAL